MLQRGWTADQISEALENGRKMPAVNQVNPANPGNAIHPSDNGPLVVVDDVTQEVIMSAETASSTNAVEIYVPYFMRGPTCCVN